MECCVQILMVSLDIRLRKELLKFNPNCGRFWSSTSFWKHSSTTKPSIEPLRHCYHLTIYLHFLLITIIWRTSCPASLTHASILWSFFTLPEMLRASFICCHNFGCIITGLTDVSSMFLNMPSGNCQAWECWRSASSLQ